MHVRKFNYLKRKEKKVIVETKSVLILGIIFFKK